MASKRLNCSVFILTICFWIFWNEFAKFFFWLIQWQTLSDKTKLYDFFNLYQHGQLWLSQYFNPQTHFVPSHTLGYLPTSFPFFGIFALFNFQLAAQIWIGTCISLFIIALLTLAYTLKSNRGVLLISIAVLLFLTSYPLQTELELGQVNLLIASLTVLSLVSQRCKHNFASAFLLSIGTILKGPPVLFLIYFVVFRRDLRYLINFFVSTLGIVAISLFVVPIQWYLNWISNDAPTLTGYVSTGFVSLAGMSSLSPIIFLVGVCVLTVFAFYVNSDRFAGLGKSPLRADGMFLMITLVMLFAGRSVYPSDYVWIILPAALFISGLMLEEIRIAYLALVGLATFLMNVTPDPIFMFYVYRAMTLPTFTVGSLIMVISLIPICIYPKAIFRSAVSRNSGVSYARSSQAHT